jgi:ABC-type multidrug transport system permease subunit
MGQNTLIGVKKGVANFWKFQITIYLFLFWQFKVLVIIPSCVKWLIWMLRNSN